MEVEDGLLLLESQPVVTGDPSIVLVDLAVAVLPVMELAVGDAQPGDVAAGGDVGLVRPGADEVDDLVAGVVGNPSGGQASPRLFFSWTCSSMSSARTSSLRWSLAVRAAILSSLARSAWLCRLPLPAKAVAPFSKNSRCQL